LKKSLLKGYKMVLKSFSKINLTLSVTKKLTRGLHDIQSIYCLINISDTITLKKNTKEDKITFKGPFSRYVTQSNNSIKAVLNIMRKLNLISGHYNIQVYKRIPVFAGLGGGTSNAAIVLKSLKKKISTKLLDKIIDHVGTDLRLFIYNRGYLENLKKIIKIKKYKLYFLLVDPKIKCSTKKIFSNVKHYSKKKKLGKKNFATKKRFIDLIRNSQNDLQLIVEKKYPIVQKLLNSIIEEKGCYLSRMTGSGSVCYGLFHNQNSSKVALKNLRKKYPKFWFSIAKTI
tara:strand:+ start:1506 stop:2363 length:858 start_codon:yes stop_codon:yes gene_type:complete